MKCKVCGSGDIGTRNAYNRDGTRDRKIIGFALEYYCKKCGSIKIKE